MKSVCLRVDEVVSDSHVNDSWQLDVLYVNIRDESSTRETEQMSVTEILTFGNSIVEQYVLWMVKVFESQSACRHSAQTMNFPHK